MDELGIIGLGLVVVTGLVSYRGMQDPAYFARYAFEVGPIRHGRQYQRLLSSGFLHVGWWHLGFNILTLWCFGGALEAVVGMQNFLLLYFGSLVGGNLFSLWLHRHESLYTAAGASGAISGLIFASIALFPGIEVGLFGLYLPGWLYGALYVLVSAYGIVTRHSNIGHDAHLGGGLVGLATAVLLTPEILRINYLPILAIVVPAVVFLYLLVSRPAGRRVGTLFAAAPQYQTTDDRYYARKQREEVALDELLEKISITGIESLSKREKQQLDELSR